MGYAEKCYAHILRMSGNSENASRFAGLSYDTAKDLRSEAIELRDEAIKLGNAEFVTTAFGSVVSMIVVVVSGFIVWRLFKQRYFKQALGLRPEVISNES